MSQSAGIRVLVIQHVPHEGLGTFADALKEAGCSWTSVNAAGANPRWPALSEMSGLVVLGGPQSVYELARSPHLATEIALLKAALKAKLPILGICLGAQLLAAALGARVTKNPQKEIGWYPLMRQSGADGDALFEPFGQTETVFQWHGDAFALPNGAVRLASSPLCREQAFRHGDRAYGLQFHVEVTEPMMRSWLLAPSNKAELARLRGIIDPETIWRHAPEHTGRLRELAGHVASAFARRIAPPFRPSQRSAHARLA
jgi:GMP synthase (glutamine-hydrolysing)